MRAVDFAPTKSSSCQLTGDVGEHMQVDLYSCRRCVKTLAVIRVYFERKRTKHDERWDNDHQQAR